MGAEQEREQYEGPDRRATIVLTEEQLDSIAERAAKKVLETFYVEVGKVSLRVVLLLLGSLGIAILAYLGFDTKKILGG